MKEKKFPFFQKERKLKKWPGNSQIELNGKRKESTKF